MKESQLHHRVVLAIPVLNEAESVRKCLESIAAQSTLPGEVIIVDGGSQDGTIQVCEAVAAELKLPVRILINERRRVPQALNLALRECSAKYFFKITGHSTISPNFVEILVQHLEDGYWGAGGRKQAVGSSPQGRANAAALNSRVGAGGSKYHYASELSEVTHVPSGVYVAEHTREIGGWDESLPVNQDVDFDIRLRQAGGRLVLDPRAVNFWRCRETSKGLYGQYRRYGRGRAAVTRRHITSTSPRHLALILLVLGLAVAPLGLFSRCRAFLLPTLAYGGLINVAGTLVGRRSGVSGRRVTVALVAMQLGFGVGEIEGWLGRLPLPSQNGGSDSSTVGTAFTDG